MPQLKPDHISPTDEEEEEIQRQIAADPEDSAHWDDGTPARPVIEVDPELVEWSQRTHRTSQNSSDGATRSLG